MNRDIMFRGKADASIEELDELGIKHTNGWVYGSYVDGYIVNGVVEATDEYINLERWCRVDPESVGQYTGQKDKNEAPIFEGDIVELHSWKPTVKETKRQVIEWVGSGLFMRRTDGTVSGHAELPHKRLEVIGNVVDNPELLNIAQQGKGGK